MKALPLLTTTLILLFTACNKEPLQQGILIRDCTGTYLQINNKDYHICNPEKVDGGPSSSPIEASYKKLSVCKGSAADAITCMMLHPNEGWIEILQVRN